MMILTIPPAPSQANDSHPLNLREQAQLDEPTTFPSILQSLTHCELAERLVQVWLRNAGRIEKLELLRERIAATRRYLASSRRRVVLGESYLRRLLDKQAACFAAIRADRRLTTFLVREFDARRRMRSTSQGILAG